MNLESFSLQATASKVSEKADECRWMIDQHRAELEEFARRIDRAEQEAIEQLKELRK